MKMLRSENVLNVSVRRRDVAPLHVSGGAADPRGSDRRRRMDGLASLPQVTSLWSWVSSCRPSCFRLRLVPAFGCRSPHRSGEYATQGTAGKKKRILFSVLTIITCRCLSGTFYVTFFLFLWGLNDRFLLTYHVFGRIYTWMMSQYTCERICCHFPGFCDELWTGSGGGTPPLGVAHVQRPSMHNVGRTNMQIKINKCFQNPSQLGGLHSPGRQKVPFSCTATHMWEVIQRTSSFIIFICKMSVS